VNFFQPDDPSAISDLAYRTATFDMSLHAKFPSHTLCCLGVRSAGNSQLLYR